MQKLIQGVHRFRKTVYEPNRDLYRSLMDGQQPHTLFITCSDSRLSNEALTQAGPGEIFVMRNAGISKKHSPHIPPPSPSLERMSKLMLRPPARVSLYAYVNSAPVGRVLLSFSLPFALRMSQALKS